VKEGQPWVFEGNLIYIVDYNGSIPPAQMDFEKVSFWTRMFNLPLFLHECSNGSSNWKVGGHCGRCGNRG